MTALAGGKTKWKLEAAHSNQHRFVYTRSLKYHLVVMLGARIDVVEAPIWNVKAYLLPLPDKKTMSAVVKRDKTSGLDRNYSQKCWHLQRTLLIRKGSVKYCLLLLWARLKISYASHCHVWNVCVHVCKTTNWRFICLIIYCNCLYIVVINCGWNNNVAIQIVACWNWNI